MPKAKPGQDIAQLPTGVYESRDTDDEVFELDLYSYREGLRDLQKMLYSAGYQLIPDPLGDWCGFTLYAKSTPDLPGLTFPEGFYYWKRVGHGDTLIITPFLRTLRSSLISLIEGTDSKSAKKVLRDIILTFEDRARDSRTTVYATSRALLSESTPAQTTLSPLAGYHKFIPAREWFSRDIQALDARKLLTLFPDAEAKMLMLLLGRTVAGATGTSTAEGTLAHTFRSYCLIIGLQAGMGKSTLLGFITSALRYLGYTTEQINGDLNKFGWGSLATADISLIDDLTDDIQRKLLQDNRVKSLVSNGEMKVEEKGVASWNTRSITTVLGCSNTTNYSHYIGMDAGSLSRVAQLETYTQWELDQALGTDRDYRILPFWNDTAKALGTDTRVLAMWLLRCSLDYFLEVTDHRLTAAGSLRKGDQDSLEETILDLRSQLRIDINLSHAEELVTRARHLVAYTISSEGRSQKTLIANLERLDYSPDLLAALLHIFVHCPDLPEEYQDLQLNHLSLDTRPYLAAKLSDLSHQHGSKSSAKALETLTAELKSTKGFGYPKHPSFYQQAWIAEKRLIPGSLADYETLPEPPKPVLEAASRVSEILLKLL